MFSLTSVLIGLGMVAAGVCGVKWTFQIMGFTGRQQWLEKYTGAGTTYGMFKLFSVLLIMLGIFVATGWGNNIMEFLFSPFKNIFRSVGTGGSS